MNNKNSIQSVTIIILIVGCIVMMTLILFPNLVMKKNTISSLKTTDEIIKEEEEEVTNIEGPYIEINDGIIGEDVHPKLSNQFINNTINIFNTDFTAKYFGYYFKKDKLLVKEMDNLVLHNLALQEFADKLVIMNRNEEVCVNEKEVIDYSKTIFDKNVVLRELNTVIFNDIGDFYYKDGKYCGKLLKGKDPIGYNIYQKIVGYNKGTLYLQIYTKFTFCQVIIDETDKEPDCVFRNAMDIDNPNNIIGRKDFTTIPSQDIFDKANTYKYIFKIDDDNLYFISVEKVE